METKKMKLLKGFAEKLPYFRDLPPHLDGINPLWMGVSDDTVKMFVDLVAVAKTQVTGDDQKSIAGGLDSHLGNGIQRPVVLQLVALLVQLSRWVKDGNDPSKLFEYIKRRWAHAAYKTGDRGYRVLAWVAQDVKLDLQDCKTGYVFDRPRLT